MTSEWQPKVKTIEDWKNLHVLDITMLFGKFKDHEHEITRLKTSEENVKKKEKKFIVRQSSTSKAIPLEQVNIY